MRKHPESLSAGYKLLFFVVLFLILVLIIFRPFHQEELLSENLSIQTNSSETTLQEESLVSTSDLKNGLCEVYYLEQKDSLQLDKHDILVDKIGSTSVRVIVDKEELLIASGEEVYAGTGIRMELPKGKLLYFGNDNEDNAVSLLIGCKRGENPNDKYIADKGKDICEDIYEMCKESFGID